MKKNNENLLMLKFLSHLICSTVRRQESSIFHKIASVSKVPRG